MKTMTKTVSEKQAYEALRLAQINADLTEKPMKSSALSCVKDAEAMYNAGQFAYCLERAKESLRYSVGVFHPAFAAVSEVTPNRSR